MSALPATDPITKAEFARRRSVSPGRVSQWISEKKISGDALVGEGREQRVNEAIACQQLRIRLDVNQVTGNGLDTNLALSPSSPPAADAALPIEQPPAQTPPTAPAPTISDEVGEAIKRNKLEQLERQNRQEQRDELVDAGRLTDAGAVKQEVGRAIARLNGEFDGTLASFATALSAEFKLPQRDVLHLLRREFRKFRADKAQAIRSEAEALPSMVDFDPSPEALPAQPALEAAE